MRAGVWWKKKHVGGRSPFLLPHSSPFPKLSYLVNKVWWKGIVRACVWERKSACAGRDVSPLWLFNRTLFPWVDKKIRGLSMRLWFIFSLPHSSPFPKFSFLVNKVWWKRDGRQVCQNFRSSKFLIIGSATFWRQKKVFDDWFEPQSPTFWWSKAVKKSYFFIWLL